MGKCRCDGCVDDTLGCEFVKCSSRCCGGCVIDVHGLAEDVLIDVMSLPEWKAAADAVERAKEQYDRGELTLDEYKSIDCMCRHRAYVAAESLNEIRIS